MRPTEDLHPGDGDLPLGTRPVSFVVVLAAVALAAFMLVSTFTGLVQAGMLNGGPTLVEVPDLVGTQESEATQQLSDTDLVPVVTIAQNVQVPPGEIISQRPFPGERVSTGTSVELVVSAGDGFARVPDLRGSPTHELYLMLAAHGFRIGEITEEVNDLVAAGEVIRQEPERGELLLYGETIDIVVSTGPPMIEVPDVRGEPEAEAVRILDEAGFDPQVRSRPSFSVPRGHAMSTDPRTDEEAPRGSRVIVDISTGAPPTTSTTTAPSPEPSDTTQPPTSAPEQPTETFVPFQPGELTTE